MGKFIRETFVATCILVGLLLLAGYPSFEPDLPRWDPQGVSQNK